MVSTGGLLGRLFAEEQHEQQHVTALGTCLNINHEHASLQTWVTPGRTSSVYRCALIFSWSRKHWDARNVSYEHLANVSGSNGKKYFSPKMRRFHENISIHKYERWCFSRYLYFHATWMNDLDFITIATPHFVMYHCHTANGMVRTTKIQQVIIIEVPLTIYNE